MKYVNIVSYFNVTKKSFNQHPTDFLQTLHYFIDFYMLITMVRTIAQKFDSPIVSSIS